MRRESTKVNRADMHGGRSAALSERPTRDMMEDDRAGFLHAARDGIEGPKRPAASTAALGHRAEANVVRAHNWKAPRHAGISCATASFVV